MPEYNVLLCCTGSVASIKIPEIIARLQSSSHKINVKVVASNNALHFFNASTLTVPVISDLDSLQAENNEDELSDELVSWADLLVIAPLDANSLAKVANGIADNIVTSVIRGWDVSRPLLFAPAMNTTMWNHPLTVLHVRQLQSFGFKNIECIEKTLVCGDTGIGAMATVDTIIQKIEQQLDNSNDIASLFSTSDE